MIIIRKLLPLFKIDKGDNNIISPNVNVNKRWRIPMEKSKMDNPEKLAIYSTQDGEKQNTICVWHHYTQTNTNTNNINKTRALLQTTGGKDKPNIVFMQKSQRTSQQETKKIILFSPLTYLD